MTWYADNEGKRPFPQCPFVLKKRQKRREEGHVDFIVMGLQLGDEGPEKHLYRYEFASKKINVDEFQNNLDYLLEEFREVGPKDSQPKEADQ